MTKTTISHIYAITRTFRQTAPHRTDPSIVPMTRERAMHYVTLLRAILPHDAHISSGSTPDHANVWVSLQGMVGDPLVMYSDTTCRAYLAQLQS